MEDIFVQKATSEECNLILPLVKLMIDYQSAIEPSTLKSSGEIDTQNLKEHVKNLLSDKSINIFYAKNENEILGYVMGQIDETGPDQKGTRVGKVIDLFIKQKQRGKGVGTKLLNTIINWFKTEKINRVELSVYSKNTEAIAVWEKLGFKEFRKNMFIEL